MISFDEFLKQDDEEKYNNMQCAIFEIQALKDELENRDIYISKLEVAYSKEIERLNNIINKKEQFLGDNIKRLEREVVKRDNIINELEKYCNEEIEDYDKHINSKFITDIAREQYEGEKVCFEDMLGKLQELKGDDKE